MRTVTTTEGQESCQIDLPHPQNKVEDNNSDQANEEVLTKDDLINIIDALKKGGFTTTNWHSLGLQLTIKYDDLNNIEHNYPQNVERCLTECLVKWLKTGEATYTGLAGALEKMGEDAAANHIRTNNISSSPKAKRRRT